MNDITIIGDVCIDRYHYGKVERISPEAPIPIFDLTSTEDRIGMSGNVALNVKAMGVTPTLIGYGNIEVKNCLRNSSIDEKLFLVPQQFSIIKNRFIANNQTILRVDDETYLKENPKLDIPKSKIIIIQDYGKGTVTKELIKKAKKKCKYLLIDPCSKVDISNYNVSPFCIFPNKKEASALIRNNSDDYSNVINIIRRETNAEYVALKLSEEGVMFGGSFSNDLLKLESNIKNPVDVTGAGDTFIAAFAVALLEGMFIQNVIKFANIAAGIACMKKGTSVVSWQETLHDYLPT